MAKLKVYAKEHFKVLREGPTLDIAWHGLLDLTYELKQEDGVNHIALKGNLDLETPERTTKGKTKKNAR